MKIRNKLFEYTNDELFIGDRKVMDIYCNLYDLIIKSNNKCLEHHTSENQLYYFINFNYTNFKYLNIKYKWVCFSDMECYKYHYKGQCCFYRKH